MIKDVLLSIISIAGGILIGYFTPFIQWKIQKQKEKYEARKQLINSVREYFNKIENFDSRAFCNTVLYSQIRPYLSNRIINELERYTGIIHIVENHHRYGIDTDILDELKELEIKWKLI